MHIVSLSQHLSSSYSFLLISLQTGIFVAIPSLDIPCCMFQKGVGAVPPTFLQGFNYSGFNDSLPGISFPLIPLLSKKR